MVNEFNFSSAIKRKVFTLNQARHNNRIKHLLPKRDPVAQEFLLEEIRALQE